MEKMIEAGARHLIMRAALAGADHMLASQPEQDWEGAADAALRSLPPSMVVRRTDMLVLVAEAVPLLRLVRSTDYETPRRQLGERPPPPRKVP